MFDASLQSKLAQSYADAMLGYAEAATAAYVSAFGQVLDFWAGAARAASGVEPERSRSRLPTLFAPGRQGQLELWPSTGEAFWPFATPWSYNPWASLRAFSLPGPALADMMQPFGSFFWPAASWRQSQVVWPMAFAMISFGVPRGVAFPAAEANASALEAAEAAGAVLQNAFSSYRSEGGHASAQLVLLKRFAAALMLTALSTAALWPLMAGVSAGSRPAGF
jgi:hypothetical protein